MENQPLWCCFEGFVLRLRLLVASVPGSPAGGRYGACLPLDHVVRCSSASGAVVRVLTYWGPLLVLGSFVSPATEILLFFLDSFEVVVEWFSSSHYWSLLHWRRLSVFRPASAGDRYLFGLRAGDCGLLLRWRAGIDGCLSFPSFWCGGRLRLIYPRCFVHRPEFISGQS